MPGTAAGPSTVLRVDRDSGVPLYRQVADQLTAAIDRGQLVPGDLIEDEVSLARRLAVARPTIRQAIGELVSQGLLIRRRGAGTTVAERVVHRRVRLSSLNDDLLAAGRRPSTTVLQVAETVDQLAAQALGLPADAPLVYLERVRSADEVPLAVLRNWIPITVLGPDPITAGELTEHGLYEVLRARGVRPVVARQRISARRARVRECELLGIGRAAPVLAMTRSAFDADAGAVEYGDHCYRGDQYTVDVQVHER